MTEEARDNVLEQMYTLLQELHEDFQFVRKHCNMLRGTQVLEFDEVCSMLRQSACSVLRPRETGQLVGFMSGRRRMYSQREVEAFIVRMETGNDTQIFD